MDGRDAVIVEIHRGPLDGRVKVLPDRIESDLRGSRDLQSNEIFCGLCHTKPAKGLGNLRVIRHMSLLYGSEGGKHEHCCSDLRQTQFPSEHYGI